MSFITIHFGVVVDIADENGSLKSIYERPPDQYASEYLQGRGNYVLLKVSKKTDSVTGKEFSTFDPLLNNLPEIYPDLMSKVNNNKINPDVGLPIQSSSQMPPQKSSLQTRTKSRSTKPRSPAPPYRAGSIAGSALPSTTKIRSSK
ncbi:hypothetical protein ACROYT_G021607 [Oculina patagonica]